MREYKSNRLLSCQNGSSAVEFALVVPVLLTLFFGVMAYGIYFGAVHGVQQLAAEAARASIPGLNNDERVSLARASLDRNIHSYPFLARKYLSVTAAETDEATDSFKVTLTYDASAMAIFTLPFVPLPAEVISRSASIQRGGF